MIRLGIITESATAADSQDATGTYAADITESATAADSTNAAGVYPVATTESATATDSQDGSMLKEDAVSESATASDSSSVLLTRAGDITESATATDTNAALLTQSASITETATASDSSSNLLTTSALINESCVATDSNSALAIYAAIITESCTATDITTAEIVGGGLPSGTYRLLKNTLIQEWLNKFLKYYRQDDFNYIIITNEYDPKDADNYKFQIKIDLNAEATTKVILTIKDKKVKRRLMDLLKHYRAEPFYYSIVANDPIWKGDWWSEVDAMEVSEVT